MTQLRLGSDPDSAMPGDLAETLSGELANLRTVADDVNEFLVAFFGRIWDELNEAHAYGQCLDFNEFDRVTHRYERQIAKIRCLLWDMEDAACDAGVEPARSHRDGSSRQQLERGIETIKVKGGVL